MPYYDYKCDGCGNIDEEMRKIDDRDVPGKCSKCGGETSMCLPVVSFNIKYYKRIYGKKVDPGDPRHRTPR